MSFCNLRHYHPANLCAGTYMNDFDVWIETTGGVKHMNRTLAIDLDVSYRISHRVGVRSISSAVEYYIPIPNCGTHSFKAAQVVNDDLDFILN